MFLLLALFACTQDSDGDGVVDDVDCSPDDATVSLGQVVWADADGDGFGAGDWRYACQETEGWSSQDGDCDDDDPATHPGADEVCDAADNDCDGAIDDQATDATTWFADFDQDGFGSAAWSVAACEAPAGAVDNDADCDDASAQVHPDATERCNGWDDDCNGEADEGSAVDAPTWFVDADDDGYGADAETLRACSQPDGHSALSGDCDDGKPHVNPGAEEVCDTLDNDCDGATDFDGWLPGDYADLDDVMDNAPADAHVCIDRGTWAGGGYERDQSLHLHGSGVDATVLDAGGQPFARLDDADLSLVDLEVTRAVATGTYGYGGVAYFQDRGDLALTRVRLSDGGCDVTRSCYGAVAYWDDGGGLVARDVEVVGLTWDSTYTYTYWYGPFYGYYVDFDVDGMEIHDTHVDVRYHYSQTFTVEGSIHARNVHVHDNTVTAAYGYGGTLYVDDGYGDVVLENWTIEDNTYGYEYYGYTLGFYLEDVYGGVTVRNLALVDNTMTVANYGYLYGMAAYVNYGSADMENVLVAGNRVTYESHGYVYGGALYGEYGDFRLVNADVADNELTGVYEVYGSLMYLYQSDGEVFNTTLASVDYGDATVYGGLYLEDADVVEAYNNVHDTPSDEGWVYDDDEGQVSGSAMYGQNPQYTDRANRDYTLSSTSGMVDAGDPAVLDPDGSRSDVGAHGGPGGDSW